MTNPEPEKKTQIIIELLNRNINTGRAVMVLSEIPEIHLSPGRPDVEPFQSFNFDVN